MEVVAITKAGDGGGMNQDGSNEGDEMWLNFWIKQWKFLLLRVNLLRTRSVSYTFLSSELNIGHAV